MISIFTKKVRVCRTPGRAQSFASASGYVEERLLALSAGVPLQFVDLGKIIGAIPIRHDASVKEVYAIKLANYSEPIRNITG
ncbi:MAG: hypothetical protein WD051_06920 [Steroidobacteraceae bacterium]